MVQQRVEDPTADDQDLVIEDTTSPEQLAREAEIGSGTPPGREPVAEPDSESPAEATPPAEPPQAEAPEAQVPPTPPTRTYTEEEYRRIQSAKDREVAAERRRAEDAQRRLNELNLDAQVEAYLRTEEQRLAQQLGPDEARQFVRTPERTKTVRDHYVSQQRLQEVQQRETQMGLEQELQAKVITARHFIQTYNVAAEDQELLLAVNTPDEMEKVAKRLGRKVQQNAARRAAVPAETQQTSLESGMSGTSAPESEDTRVGRLNDTPSWEWSDDDIRFMRRQ